MAKEMAAKPPLALEYVKWAVNEGMQMDLDRALLFESALFAHLYSTEDQKEASGPEPSDDAGGELPPWTGVSCLQGGLQLAAAS